MKSIPVSNKDYEVLSRLAKRLNVPIKELVVRGAILYALMAEAFGRERVEKVAKLAEADEDVAKEVLQKAVGTKVVERPVVVEKVVERPSGKMPEDVMYMARELYEWLSKRDRIRLYKDLGKQNVERLLSFLARVAGMQHTAPREGATEEVPEWIRRSQWVEVLRSRYAVERPMLVQTA